MKQKRALAKLEETLSNLVALSKTERANSVSVVLAAAGNSERFGRPKPLVEICGKRLFEYSLDAFLKSRSVREIVLAIRKEDKPIFRLVLSEYKSEKLIKLCIGGDTRDESVLRAFLACDKNTDFVAFHDAARPLIQTEDIDRVIEDAFLFNASTAAFPIVDSLKRVKFANIISDVPRDDLYAVSTPQIFQKDMYEVSRAVCKKDGFSATDDNAYVTHAGFHVHVTKVSGNPKLTYPEDLADIELKLKSRKGDAL